MLGKLIYNHDTFDIILGFHHYYYKYDIQYEQDENNNNLFYCFINYVPNKKLASITQYYSSPSYDNNSILCQQNNSSPSQENVINVAGINKPHKFWIGFSITKSVINAQWKKIISTEVMKWVKNKSCIPDYVHCECDILNRWKFFIYYKYFYRQRGMSTKEIEEAEKIAAGLRVIPTRTGCPTAPKWIEKLIKYLKQIQFIDKSIVINQIGINVYYNNHKTNDIVYSGIDPHKEDNKFSVVYSVSIYSDKYSGKVYLSFNLRANHSLGDIKIPLNDCDGSILYNPSWCLNIVSHSVSHWESKFGRNDWRIVILLRNVWDENIKQAKAFYDKHNS